MGHKITLIIKVFAKFGDFLDHGEVTQFSVYCRTSFKIPFTRHLSSSLPPEQVERSFSILRLHILDNSWDDWCVTDTGKSGR